MPLRYAYESDPAAGTKCASTGDDCDKAFAEGWAFAAAVLPRLNYCDPSVAKLVKDNLDVTAIAGASTQGNSQMTDGHAKLKTEVEMPSATLRCFEVAVLKSLPVLGHTRRLLAEYTIQLLVHSNPKFPSSLLVVERF